jgi:hypothetical protein
LAVDRLGVDGLARIGVVEPGPGLLEMVERLSE